MREIAPDLERWRARGERFALATVVASRRSSPRPVGAKLAVTADGGVAGSVSAGCVEGEAAEAAKSVLDGAPPRLLTFGIADELALSVGLPCGGEIDVFVHEPPPDAVDGALDALRRGVPAAMLVRLAGESAGAVSFLAADELEGLDRSQIVDYGGGPMFVDFYGPPPRLLVFGAVDIAEALCRGARELGWRTIVADARPRLATSERVPSADELLAAWPEDVLERVRPDAATAVVVLTHEDRFDLPALAGALRTDAFYVGALGSRRNQERRRALLRELGLADADLDRIAGPCGLDLGAETPAETALSILAEIVARRAGRTGAPLKEGSGRIHAGIA